MREAWVLRTTAPVDDIAPVRRVRGIDAARLGDQLWLRGRTWTPELARDLAGAHYTRFDDLGDGQLAPPGATVPTEATPALDWQPVAKALEVTLHAPDAPPPLAATLPPPDSIRLVANGSVRPAAAVLTTLADFARWAEFAPAPRLRPLSFAVRRDAGEEGEALAQTLVVGSPLPPVPGTAMWEDAGLLIPCGCALAPALPRAEARRILDFDFGPHARFVFLPDGSVHGIREEDFAVASRATIRASSRRLGIDTR